MAEIQELPGVNLYSDTQTLPTDAMREAMYRAVVGDDMRGLDPTVRALQAFAAQRVAAEAALFVPSGHMGNLIAVLGHCKPGDEVILEAESHMVHYEAGSVASIAGVMPRLVTGDRGVFDAEAVEALLHEEDIHLPRTRLICVESPHNRGGGTVMPLVNIQGLRKLATRRGLAMHLDGARLFNAAAALGVAAAEIASYFDSVMFCLSKGLSAPVGSILAGSKGFIAEALRHRKRLGGAMRQAGVLAAAGLVAMKDMVDRIPEDHRNARLLGEGLKALPGHDVDLRTVQTNMVSVDVRGLGITAAEYVAKLTERGIEASARPPWQVRFVTHRHVSQADVAAAINAAAQIADECGT